MKSIDAKYIVAIIVSLIIGCSIIGYGYLDYKYKTEALEQKMTIEEQARKDREAKEKAVLMKQSQLQECLDDVGERTSNIINNKNNKPISDEGIKFLLNLAKDQKEECFKKYK
jgi:hypothetical protein